MLFPATLTSVQRRLVHEVAEHLGMDHFSDGDRGSNRRVRCVRVSTAVHLQRLQQMFHLRRALEEFSAGQPHSFRP